MCGIAGIALRGDIAGADLRGRIERMIQAQIARGPDDGGTYLSPDGSVALGNRRLAIQDLSPAGHMPMSNADGTVWITYNGELYNVDELRPELERLGFAFRSHSDSEVLLHGYEAWGPSIVKRLRGMFAFGVYDQRTEPSLFLARDPLGIKPLYYAFKDGALTFASSCKGVLASGLVDRSISPAGLVNYLQLGSVPAPLTIYQDVRALGAGQHLTLKWKPTGVCLGQPVDYWAIPAETEEGREVPYGELIAQVRALLLDSVRRHLVSDVPLGVFLSGGLDSSSIVALMRQASPAGEIRTCSVVFGEQEYSEGDYATEVARQFATRHTEVVMTADALAAQFEHVVEALDQPSNDGINTYIVSQAARRASLTVALSGIGGDELFGGYPTFRRLAPVLGAARVADSVPAGRRLLTATLSARGAEHPAARLAGWLRRGGGQPAAAYLGLRGLFSATTLSMLVRSEVLDAAAADLDLLQLVDHAVPRGKRCTPWGYVSRLELTCYLRHQLLRDCDAMSMAHSLEVRVPFVDQLVVESILTSDVAPRNGALPKQLLRDVVPALPAKVRERAYKQGFSFPFRPWLSGPLRPLLGELVSAASAAYSDFLQPEACDRVLRAFDQGRTHWSRPWALAALCTTLSRT